MRVSAAGPWRPTCRTEARDWLRRHRVELNAMTTPQFIGWLDDKMAAFGNGKLVPPARVLTNDLSETLEVRLHRQITEQILREARIEEKVAAALQKMDLPVPEELARWWKLLSWTSLRPRGVTRSSGSQISCWHRRDVTAARRSTAHEIWPEPRRRDEASRQSDRPGRAARVSPRARGAAGGRSRWPDRGSQPTRRFARTHAQVGGIDEAMYDAARAFQADFTIANLDPIRAVSMLRVPGAGREPDLNGRPARRPATGACGAAGAGRDRQPGRLLCLACGRLAAQRA